VLIIDLLNLGIEDVRVIISMMLTCDAGVVVGYDRRRSRLCNVAINRKYDNYRTEI